MLTFFRKIRRSLLGSGQAQKYAIYAIGEIALVVIGILIALQVNNWNLQRIERKEELNIVRTLYKELLENEQFLDERMSFLEERKNSGQFLLSKTGPAPEYMPYDTLLIHVVRAYTTAGYSPRISSFQRIINNEEFNLIRLDSLKLLLNNYNVQINLGINNYNTVWADNFDTVIADLFGNVNLTSAQGKLYEIPDLNAIEASMLFDRDPAKILSDPEFESRIALILRKNVFTQNRLNQNLELVHHLKQFMGHHYNLN